MRQFRGLTKEGKWVYGWYCKVIGYHYIIPNDADIWGVKPPDTYGIIGSIEVIPESVGQQTGIKDKSGTEIYEGDIVRKVQDKEFTPDNCKKYNGATAQVVYSLWPFGEFQLDLIEGEKWSFYYPDGVNFSAEELEVISNIHQEEKQPSSG